MSIEKHVDLETLASVITSIPSNIFLKDTDLRYIFSSHIWEQVDCGEDEDFDIYGKTDRDIRKDTANIDNVEIADRKILETGVGTSYVIKSVVDGHIQYLELVKEPVRNKQGEIIGIVGLINDVTKVTQEMSDMLENEKAYRNAMKQGALLAYTVNLSKDILEDDLMETIGETEVNLLDILGLKAPCSYSDMIERYVRMMLVGDCQKTYSDTHNSQRYVELYNSGQRQIVQEFKLLVNGIDNRQIEMWSYETVLLMKNTDGDLIAFFTINDISEQRRKEEQIRIQLEENVKEAERIANMKSDFLANMSHEIRTPMNAVIGMAEMALREELPDAARDYINQIKSSGNALLNIINDVLDFSKIESGKMDIIPDNYDPLSVIHDMSGILMSRIGEKDIEFIANINPKLPIGLFGDSLRLRQIVINLANNAIKFTKSGFVETNVDFDIIGEDEILLKIDVVDSGIGIKEEDLGKLFVSFQQVDSKRNRNIEGTGLGLAICSRLVALMGGTVSVSSEYGKGSTFSFSIPQKVTDWTPSLEIEDKENKAIIGCWEEGPVADRLSDLWDSLEIAHGSFENFERDNRIAGEVFASKKNFVLTNYRIYTERLAAYADAHPELEFIVLCDWTLSVDSTKPNVMFIRKPISTIGIAMALNHKFYHVMGNEAMEFEFVAPDAKVLIVDDNEVNLVVAEGLIEPLKMQVKTALSGKKALELLETEQFDLVFMDHMMPELDGVETTRIIRDTHPELESMPIIALSANAVGGAKEIFLSAGMNDFVAKPIEIKSITRTIKQWLPKDKIIKKMGGDEATSQSPDAEGALQSDAAEVNLNIGDLDVEGAITMVGNQKLYFTILEKYAGSIRTKAKIIKDCEAAEDIKSYTIEVHALKSSSKQIGAMELSAMAAELEACGHAEDIATIHEKTDQLIERYLGYCAVLDPLFGIGDAAGAEESSDKPELSVEQLLDYFEKMLAAAEELDMDAMEEIAAEMGQYRYEGEAAEYKSKLDEAVANIDVDCIEEIIDAWKQLVE